MATVGRVNNFFAVLVLLACVREARTRELSSVRGAHMRISPLPAECGSRQQKGPAFRRPLAALRGGTDSTHDDWGGEMGAQDDWGGEMGAESLSSSSEDEPSCSEALRRMAELVQGAREGAQGGLQDGYALLQELEFEGLPVNTVFFNDFLRVAVELAKGGQASTVDGERIVERLEREGLEANEDTYLQMMLLIAAGAKHKDPEPKGFLSEGYQWLAKMDKQGLNISEPVVDAYIDIYHAQMPNVYELDPYEHNWCVNTDSEEALWQANAELGIEPHIKTTYTPEEVAEMAEAEQRLLGQDPDAGKESSEIEDYLSSDSPQPTSSSI